MNKQSDGVVHTNSVCIKKSMLTDCGIYFAPGEKKGEDVDMWLRCSLESPVVFTKTITTHYRRELSTATKNSMHTNDWVFERRKDDILKNPKYGNKKRSIECFLDRYNMACSRVFASENDKAAARVCLGKVFHKNLKYYVTRIIILLPFKMIKK